MKTKIQTPFYQDLLLQVKNNEKIVLAILIFLAFILILTPQLIRNKNADGFLPSDKSYYYILNANSLNEKGLSNYISTETQDDIIGGYTITLGLLNPYFDINNLIKFSFFISSIISIILLFYILKEFQLNLENRLIIILIWIFSPIFIYSNSIANPFVIIIPLDLLIIFLFSNTSKTNYQWFTLPLFLIIPFFGIINTLLLTTILIYYIIQIDTIYKKRHLKKIDQKTYHQKKIISTISIIIMFISSFYYLFIINNLNIFNFISLENILYNLNLNLTRIIQNNITSFGAEIGFNVFILILTTIGLTKSWKPTKDLVWPYLIILFLIIITNIFYNETKIILNIIISIYAGVGLISIIKMKWDEDLIKQLTIFILIIGILFSSYSIIMRISTMNPNSEMIDSISYINKISKSDDTILSHIDNGHILEFFSNRTALLKSQIINTKSLIKEYQYVDANTLLKTRNEETAQLLIEKNHINIFYIDSKTRILMINDDNLIGLEFLMQNSKNYILIKTYNNSDIWVYREY